MAVTDRSAREAELQRRKPVSLLGQWSSPLTSYYLLVGVTSLLLIFGLVMVLSSSSVTSVAAGQSAYAVFLDQAKFALIGIPACFLASRIAPSRLKILSWPLLILAIILQVLVFVPGLGHGRGGNFAWLSIGPLTLQPSELAKLALCLWLAAVLSTKAHLLEQTSHLLIPAIPVVVVVIGLVLAGRDVGTGLIFFLLVAAAFFTAGVRLRWFAAAGVATALMLVTLVVSSKSRHARVSEFLSGGGDPQNAGYQLKHGLRALGSGGWGGIGLGASREKWQYLPEAHNDFIFAIIGEELGLIGTLMVVLLFSLLALSVFRIIHRSQDMFVRIATGAIGAWVIGQGLLNIAVVVGLLPVFGVPLPLVSAGGSALIVTLVAVGVLISFARHEPGAQAALAARRRSARGTVSIVSAPRRVRGGERENG